MAPMPASPVDAGRAAPWLPCMRVRRRWNPLSINGLRRPRLDPSTEESRVMTPEQQAAILEILDGTDDLTVATVREDGYPQATTVSFVHSGLKIYFGCDAGSQKARNIERTDKVSITVDLPYERWTEIRGLSLGGRARFVTDPDEERSVFELMSNKFPEISELTTEVDRQNGRLVCVEPEVVSLLDYRKGFGHAEQIDLTQG